MNERDPLEVELEQLRPVAPPRSLDIRIRRSMYPRWRWIGLAAGLALAACVAAGLLLWRSPAPPRPSNLVHRDEPSAAPLPTLADFRRALATSPEAVDRLLDAQAARTFSSPRPVRAFSRADTLPFQ